MSSFNRFVSSSVMRGSTLSVVEKHKIAKYVALCDSADTEDLQFWTKVINEVLPSSKKLQLQSPAQVRHLYMKEIYKITFRIKVNEKPVIFEETSELRANKLSPLANKLNDIQLNEIKQAYEAFKIEAIRISLLEDLARKFRLQGLDVSSIELINVYERTFGARKKINFQMRMQKLPVEFLQDSVISTEKIHGVKLPNNVFKSERFVILNIESSWLARTERRFLEYVILVYGGQIEYDIEKYDEKTVPLLVGSNECALESCILRYKRLYSSKVITTSIENGVYDPQKNELYSIPGTRTAIQCENLSKN